MPDLTGEQLMAEVGRILAADPDQRLSHNGHLGLRGNAGHESAGLTTRTQVRGPGRGLFQWDSRRPEFERYLRNRGFRPDDYMNPAANAGFVKEELLGAEGRRQTYDIPGFGPMRLLDALRSDQIPVNEMVDLGHQVYERPADVGNETLTSNPGRQDWAQRAGNLFTQWGGWSSPNPVNPQGYGPGVTGEDRPGINLTAPNDPFGVGGRLPGPSPYGGQRSGGADIAGYDLTGLAFDRHGNPLSNTSVSATLSDKLRGLRESYERRGYDPGESGPQGNYGGRYAYAGEIRPQDAIFLDQVPGASITREGRYVLPTDYAAAILGLDPDASDYAGRYDTPGGPSLQDALFLQQNPSFTLARGGANTGYGYRLDPETGAYVPNTTGTGGTAQPPGNSTPNPAPNTGVFGNQPAPNPSDINGFNTPPTPFQPLNQDYINASSPAGYNPSAFASSPAGYNPSALASTIPGFNDPGGSLYNPAPPTIASFGNPSFLGGLPSTPLGSSGVSPSTVGPSGVANPFGGDPNRTTEPRGISISMPNTLDW